MERFFQDLRFGLRGLVKHPALTAVAVLSLGLGIGANTTVFTWVQRFVLQPLPVVPDAGSLVTVNTRATGGGDWSVSYPDFSDWRAQSRTTDLALYDMTQLGMRLGGGGDGGDGGTERVWGMYTSDNYFDVLGVRALHGRTFIPGDEADAAQVAVLSWAFWQRRFAGDSAVIGQAVTLNGQSFTVVGVTPPRFGGTIVGLNFDLFVPATTVRVLRDTGTELLRERQWQTYDVVGRLKPGTTYERARQEVDQVARAAGIAGGVAEHQGAVVKHFTDEGAPSFLGPVLLALLGVTGVVLLIACANVANLLLARAAGRRREIAIRLAVGASRARLVRQLLTESLALALLAGVVGIVCAFWGRDLLAAFVPAGPFPIGLDMRVDGTVLLFALLVTLVTALIFGLAPALQASRPDLVPTLKDEIGTGPAGRARLQHVLVVGQVALSLVSLVCAGLFIRSLQSANRVDVGFHTPDRVMLATTEFALGGFENDTAAVAVTQRLLERVRTMPGVRTASAAMLVPLGFGGNSSSGTWVEGYTPRPDENMSIRYNIVAGDYFPAMGVRIVAGRGITDQDVADNAPVVVVNEHFVQKYLAGREPIGARLNSGGDTLSIVGVAQAGKYSELTEDPRAIVYRTFSLRFAPSSLTIHARSDGDARAITPALRRAFQETSAELPFLDVRTLGEHIQAAFFIQKIGAYMLAAFGVLALSLSAIGIYGVMSYGVTRRSREIGVRVALGAGRGSVVNMVVGQAMRLAAIGLAIGLVVAAGAGQLLASQLLGVSPRDPITFAAIGLLLGGVALVAAWIPARRAARVDPMVALRYE